MAASEVWRDPVTARDAAGDIKAVEAIAGGAKHVGNKAIADRKDSFARRVAGEGQRVVIDCGVRLSVLDDAAADRLIAIGQGTGADFGIGADHDNSIGIEAVERHVAGSECF